MQNAPHSQIPIRDIHLPEPLTGWWPPAPGWWLLIGLFICLCGLVCFLLRLRRQRRWRVAALAELASIESFYKSNNDRTRLLRDLSTLLRRVAILRFPRTECASLTGDEWLTFLDTAAAIDGFRNGPGKLLIDGPYQRPTEDTGSEAELINLCRTWLQKLPRKASS